MAAPSKIASPAPAPAAGSKRLVKILVLLGLAGVLGFLFIRSVRGTRAEPYTIPPGSLDGWTLAFQAPASANDAGFVLHVPAELTRAVFDQVFKRTMESMSMSGTPSVPLLTQRELDGPLAGRLTPEAITAIARDSGLLAPFVPRCLAHRRVSETTSTQQLYFMLFDAPAFTRFRDAIAARVRDGATAPGAFDPTALSPVLFIGVSESIFGRWMPLRADPQADCFAPIAPQATAH